MQYVKFHYSVPYAGCDYEEYVAFQTSKTEKELQERADEGAQLNGESYEYIAETRDDDSDEDDYILDWYWQDVYGYFEIVTKEEWEENEGTVED